MTWPGSAAGIGSAMHDLHRNDAEPFAFAFDPTYRRLSRPFGVTPQSAWVEIGGGLLKARFGAWRVTTPLNNVKGAEVTGRMPSSRPRGRRAWRSPTAGSRSPRTGVAACASTSAHRCPGSTHCG
jgi:hypothetical protein